MTDAHALLPWYVNGTLEPAERKEFQEHLQACSRCARELPVLEELRRQAREPEWAAHAEHPETEALSRVVAEGEVDPEVTRHLAVCLTCSQEARWLRVEEAAEAEPGPARRPSQSGAAPRGRGGRAFPAIGWALPATAAAAVLGLVAGRLLWSPPAGPVTGVSVPVTGVSTPIFVPATERGRDDRHAVPMTPDFPSLQLHFQVDLGPEEFPALFEVRDAAGGVVFSKPDLQPRDLYRGIFLFTCARADCPPGDYHARITPAGPHGPAVEYPFRIVPWP